MPVTDTSLKARDADQPQEQELSCGRSYLQLRPDRVIFQDVLDDRVRVDDRVSLLELRSLSARRPVECRLDLS